MKLKCSTCKKNLISENRFTQFKCPSCMKTTIVRCESCRRRSNLYKCGCGFEGP